MPNIIINNYCNQKCSYCFANANMKDESLMKNMSISTFLKILKFLKNNKDNNVRILGWEPIISPNIRKFLQIANKWWFDIIVFSNINTENENLKKIFEWMKWIRVNCNINDKDFYTEKELENIDKNIETLINLWIKVIIWYNICDIEKSPEFIFNLASKHNIWAINLKITNSSLWSELIMDNSSKKLWEYIFDTIKKYSNDFFIEISCWLDKNIFTKEQLEYIENNTEMKLKFWCDWNIWKFDINTDWSIFKCYPLESVYKNDYYSALNINNIIKNNIKIENIIKVLNKWFISEWECTANKKIKENL